MRSLPILSDDPRNTRPIFLIDLGTEQLSTSGDQPPYVGGVVSLNPDADWRQIALMLPPSTDRITAAVSGAYRGLLVTVQMVPAVEYAAIIQSGYVEDDYANNGVIKGAAFTVFSGSVDSFQFSGTGQIQLNARHRLLSKASIPGLRFGAPINYHCPAIGQVITFKSTAYTIKGPAQS